MDKKVVNNLALLVLGILLAALILEVTFRAFNLVQLQDDNLVNDNYLGYKIKPNLDTVIYTPEKIPFRLKTTSLGFDGIGFRDDGSEGKPDIVTIGDSFTFALGVNSSDSWPKLLENDLQKNVINMGVWGYGTISEERILERYGIQLKPKLVILDFAVNDFSDSYNFLQTTSPSKPLPDFLRDNVAIYRFLWQRLGELKHDTEIINYKDENLTFQFWPQPALKNISPKFERVATGEKFAKESILRIAKMANDNGAQFVIVILPAKEQVYWHIVKNLIPNPGEYTYDYPDDSILAFCKENNLKCLDLRPQFKEHALKGEQLFFPVDSHYNIQGNALIAEEVYKYLAQNISLK